MLIWRDALHVTFPTSVASSVSYLRTTPAQTVARMSRALSLASRRSWRGLLVSITSLSVQVTAVTLWHTTRMRPRLEPPRFFALQTNRDDHEAVEMLTAKQRRRNIDACDHNDNRDLT